MFPEDTNLELIYRCSRDSFKAAPYHQKVDNQGPHVILAKSKDYNQIFGGNILSINLNVKIKNMKFIMVLIGLNILVVELIYTYTMTAM